jgi:hypothetical protein
MIGSHLTSVFKPVRPLTVSAFLIFAAFALPITAAKKTDGEIKQELIRLSIANYKGPCPCPYSINRAGRMYGRTSAYTRPGGASPQCYEEDVTQKMVDDYRGRGMLPIESRNEGGAA